jgi:DNA-binding response OmpR family regulator
MTTTAAASTVLVVEDDDATRTFLADNLTADGYELLVADCAAEGLRLMEAKAPDLAVIDLGLPDTPGLEVVRRVREADGVASRIDPDLPLIVLTGRAEALDRVRGFERGCDDYLCNLSLVGSLRVSAARLSAGNRSAAVGGSRSASSLTTGEST